MRSHEPIGRAVDAATTWLYMRQEPRRGAGETARRRAEGGAGVATRVHCYCYSGALTGPRAPPLGLCEVRPQRGPEHIPLGSA